MIIDFRIRLFSAIILLSPLQMYCQSIPIQLMVVDQNGFEMPNTQVKLRLTMRGDTSLTTGQYQEVHNVSTNDLGVVSVDLGEGIVTTNSQVLAIDIFSFGLDEPYIKTELDTSISLTNYTNLGWMKYRYPLVARRALMADSAGYTNQSENSLFSDTAEFARNFNETYDDDTSSLNEIQDLTYNDSTGTLTISGGNSVVIQQPVSIEKAQLVKSFQHNSLTYVNWIQHYNDTLWALSPNGEILKGALSNPYPPDTLSLSYTVVGISPRDSVLLTRNGWSSFQIRNLDGTVIATQNVSGISSYYAYISSTVFKSGAVSFYVRTGYATGRFYSWDYSSNTIISKESNTLGSFSTSLSTITTYSTSPSLVYDRFTLLPVYSRAFSSYYGRMTHSSFYSNSGCGIWAVGYGGSNGYGGFKTNGQNYLGSFNLETLSPAFESGGMVFFEWNNNDKSGIGYIDLDDPQSVVYKSIISDHEHEIGASCSTIQFIQGENERVAYLIIYQAINFPVNGQRLTGDLIYRIMGD